jgi:hypothetical protein
LRLRDDGAQKVISWKNSFNRLSEEYGITKKKKQALDNLYEKGKISQSTHDSFNTEIAAAVVEIEKQQQALLEKMQAKTEELHSQIKTLEILLTNYEIQHVTGEIDENTYELEINMLGNGLELAKRELETIQGAVNQLCSPVTVTTPAIEIATSPIIETPAAPIAETVEIPAASIEVAPEIALPEPIIQESIAAPVIEEAPIMEQTAEIAETVEEVAEAVIFEETPIEETKIDKSSLGDFEVAQPEAIQKDLTQVIEEVAPENPSMEAPLEAPDAIQQEIPAETQPQPIHAKETLQEAYSNSTEENEQ